MDKHCGVPTDGPCLDCTCGSCGRCGGHGRQSGPRAAGASRPLAARSQAKRSAYVAGRAMRRIPGTVDDPRRCPPRDVPSGARGDDFLVCRGRGSVAATIRSGPVRTWRRRRERVRRWRASRTGKRDGAGRGRRLRCPSPVDERMGPARPMSRPRARGSARSRTLSAASGAAGPGRQRVEGSRSPWWQRSSLSLVEKCPPDQAGGAATCLAGAVERSARGCRSRGSQLARARPL